MHNGNCIHHFQSHRNAEVNLKARFKYIYMTLVQIERIIDYFKSVKFGLCSLMSQIWSDIWWLRTKNKTPITGWKLRLSDFHEFFSKSPLGPKYINGLRLNYFKNFVLNGLCGLILLHHFRHLHIYIFCGQRRMEF